MTSPPVGRDSRVSQAYARMAGGYGPPAGGRRPQEVCVEADGAEAILAALDPEQREVVLATRGPVCVVAGAGTGKTRAIAHRISYAVATGVLNPGHVLA